MSAAPPDDDLRVRDLLRRGELTVPRVSGAWTLAAIGRRGFARPRWATPRRIFERCGISDPWDPDAPVVPVELGEVGIPDRRPVAPHAAPPKAATPAGPPGFNPRIPMGPRATPSAERASPGPSPMIGQTRKDDTAELKRKMAEKEGAWSGRPRAPTRPDAHRVAQPVKNLPVRPGAVPTDAAVSAPAASPRPTPPPRMSVAPEPARSAPSPIRATSGAAPAERSLPGRAPPPVGKISAPAPRSGGFRLQGTVRPSERSAEPEELPLDAPPPRAAPVLDDGPEEIPLEAPPPKPAPPPPAAARPARPGGLDDLFGMGAEGATRIRIPKAEPRPEGEAARPRRPMVTDPAALAGGVDRRPPPARPPVVKPSAAPSGGRADDLPDE